MRICAISRIASRYDWRTARLIASRCFGVEPAVPPGDREAGHQPLDVPLERAGQRLVEVVEAEHQPPVRGREAAEVRQVRVPAQLHRQAGPRGAGQVGGHQVGGAAVERERRDAASGRSGSAPARAPGSWPAPRAARRGPGGPGGLPIAVGRARNVGSPRPASGVPFRRGAVRGVGPPRCACSVLGGASAGALPVLRCRHQPMAHPCGFTRLIRRGWHVVHDGGMRGPPAGRLPEPPTRDEAAAMVGADSEESPDVANESRCFRSGWAEGVRRARRCSGRCSRSRIGIGVNLTTYDARYPARRSRRSSRYDLPTGRRTCWWSGSTTSGSVRHPRSAVRSRRRTLTSWQRMDCATPGSHDCTLRAQAAGAVDGPRSPLRRDGGESCAPSSSRETCMYTKAEEWLLVKDLKENNSR